MTAFGPARARVLARDGRCIAGLMDPDAGPCYDRWGRAIRPDDMRELEADYIEVGAHGKRHELAIDHVTICPGHHRGTGPQGGRIWAKQAGRRAALRRRLEDASD